MLLLQIIIMIIISILIALVVVLINEWMIHKNTTKENSLYYGKANFQIFKEHFDKLDGKWKQNHWKDSLFYYPNNSKIHDGVVQFSNQGMVLDLVSYIKACLYVNKYIKKNFYDNKEIIKWK